MKTLFRALLLSLTVSLGVHAADPAPAATNAPAADEPPAPPSLPAMSARPTLSLTAPTVPGGKLAEPGKTVIGGSIPAIARSEAPLQMLNPLAPASYGDGTQFLSVDSRTQQANGVNLLTFSFGSKDPAKKSKKARKGSPAAVPAPTP